MALVLTKCLNRKRAKYPPFPVSHYGRFLLPLGRGVRGGLPLLLPLSLCLLCRRFTSPLGACGWGGSALPPVGLQGAVPAGFNLPAPALLALPLPPPPLTVGATDRDALVSTAASGSGRLAALPALNSTAVPFPLAPRILVLESRAAPSHSGAGAVRGRTASFQGVAWPSPPLCRRQVCV